MNNDLLDVLKEELNIKEVRFPDRAEDLLAYRATPNFRVLGKRFGGRTQQAAERIRALPSDALAAFRRGAPLAIELDGERFELSAEDIEIREEPRGELVVETDAGFTVALDTIVDNELRLEGIARELVNRIQRLRREAGFDVSDRIRLGIFGNSQVAESVERHGSAIARETLAVELKTGTAPSGDEYPNLSQVDLDGTAVWIGLTRA
jgi:isoleucyl-tRNA synthetase